MRLKKGFLFSLFVITALSLIVIVFRLQSQYTQADRADAYKSKVERTNMFVEDIEKDIERTLYVVSFRAIIGADEYIHKYGDYIDNVSLRIPELILNGTIDGEVMNSTNASTFLYWTKEIERLSHRFRINLTFENITIDVYHADPWQIEVRFRSNVSIQDYDRIIGWNFSLDKATRIDIRDAHFTDPLFYIESVRNYETNIGPLDRTPIYNNIEQSPFSYFWENRSGKIDVSNLNHHVRNQMYVKSKTGPSFLMRLEGRYNCSEPGYAIRCTRFGIESMVNVINRTRVWDFSFNGSETCAIDYQFFRTGCGKMHNIRNMSDNLFLDWNHIVEYNLTKINSS